MSHSFHIPSSKRHLFWSQSLEPALTVRSGAEVTFDLLDGGHNQIRPDNAATALRDFDFALTDPVFGPVHVLGAEPGDVLRVDVLALQPADYGWTAIFPGFGLLADDPEFAGGGGGGGEPHLKMWDLTPAGTTHMPGHGSGHTRVAVFKPGIGVPVRPFLGVVGVAPDRAGVRLSTVPPYAASGGNVDCRDLSVVGSSVYLPVHVPGALFSCGDGHAAQGDGEVCGTAVETPMRARLRLTVEKAADRRAKGRVAVAECPHYITQPRGRGAVALEDELAADKGEYVVLGVHEDPREAARMAVRGVIAWLAAEKGLTRVEAYMLCSVAAKLRMSEVVDMPNYAISCAFPLSVFL